MGDTETIVVDKSGLKKTLVLIEYPGMVKNDENMLKSLGGILKLSHTLCTSKKRVELKFHPDNIYSKPIYGDTIKTDGLLLKVIVRKRANSNEKYYQVDIIGRCKKAVKFNSLCDYQYLPIMRNQQTGRHEYIYDKLVPKNIEAMESFGKNNDVPLFLIPSYFSRSDTVAENIHRGLTRNNLSNNVLSMARNRNLDAVEIVPFNLTDPFPSKPDAKVLKRLKVKLVSDADLQKVKKLFEKCPIWNKVTLMYESQVTNDKLKCILPSLAYHFSLGPWRTMYIRYGYDPRKHFESRYYQTFDFRLRRDFSFKEFIKMKRVHYLKHKSSKQEIKSSQNIPYPYLDEGALPLARQCMYRYCDLRIPQIQEMLENIPPPLSGATCNEKLGWLTPGFEDECREIIYNVITEITKSLHTKENLSQFNDEDINDIEEDQLSGEEEEDIEHDLVGYESDIEQEDLNETITEEKENGEVLLEMFL